MSENWRPVCGYEGIYEVSDLGSVRSLDRLDARGWRRRGHILPQTPHVHSGRPSVSLTKRNRQANRMVHSLVLEAFKGPRPTGLEACHANGDRTDNRLANLRWDTRSANQLDAVRLGEHALASRTHCKRGHVLAAPNLCNYGISKGVRACLACNKGRRYRSRSREHLDLQTASDLIYERIMTGQFEQGACK
ncbi:NUMOD4 motif-containing HNH endonuclease [Mycobacteroides chelonae]|uniref:NUMOD4 motif-containing HNH endonuclease n=1 Tax=Mycobacteroides chelonae TaxID=1774 RepID=UPI0009BD480B